MAALTDMEEAILTRRIEQVMGIQVSDEALERLIIYLKTAEKQPDISDLARIVTVNETYFFREAAHYNLLFKEIVPLFVETRRPIRICSAATAIGCEAYSIAMCLEWYNKTAAQPVFYDIDAFDINPDVIAASEKGFYRKNTLRDDGAQWRSILEAYISDMENGFEVHASLKKKIRFYQHNIMDGLPAVRYDLIFFRNALIYFTANNRPKVIDILAQALTPEGFLILGVSETASVNHERLVNLFRKEVFFFQKKQGTLSADYCAGAEFQTASARHPQLGTPSPAPRPAAKISVPVKTRSHIDLKHITKILADENKTKRVFEKTEKNENELIVSIIYALHLEDIIKAEQFLFGVDKYEDSTYTYFLWGEFYYHKSMNVQAELCHKSAVQKNTGFWPAFYRLASLAANGCAVERRNAVRQALESITLGQNAGYEVFIGGFSPSACRYALEKQYEQMFV
jgi:chemotaxis protein methyltransferase CheR